MASARERDSEGGKFIPASQRPDGTWRKPRRVKDGYVPQEEVPLYESKGKKIAERTKSEYPVGFYPEVVTPKPIKQKKPSQDGANTKCVIPGLIINVDKAKKKKKKKPGAEEVTDTLSKISIDNSSKNASKEEKSSKDNPIIDISKDQAKRLKNLRKKIKDIKVLEEKINSGELKNPEKDQLDKVARKKEVENEILLLEAQVISDHN